MNNNNDEFLEFSKKEKDFWKDIGVSPDKKVDKVDLDNYFDFLVYPNNYQIIFSMGENKEGQESLNIYHNNSNAKIEAIDNSDIFGEDRKRKNNIIGTSLVNILNVSKALLEVLAEYMNLVNRLDKNMLENIYTNILKLCDKYHLQNIDTKDFEIYYYEIWDVINNSDKGIFNLKFLKQLINENTKTILLYAIEDKDTSKLKIRQQILSFLLELYSNKSTYSLGSQDIFFIYNVIIKSSNKKNLLLDTYNAILFELLSDLKLDIISKLKQTNKHFITVLFDHFYDDYNKIYSKKDKTILKYHMRLLFNNNTNSSNTYHELMFSYYSNTNRFKNINTLPVDSVTIFIKSLISDIEFLKNSVSDEKVISHVKLPTADITYAKPDDTYINSKYRVYTYNPTCLKDLFFVSMYHILLDNRALLKCKVCDKYFISETRNNELFCRRIDPKDKKERPCYIVGKKPTYTLLTEEIINLYKKISNRLSNNKENYPNEYEIFIKKYKAFKKDFKNKEHNQDIWEEEKLKWLNKYNNELKKKYPSDRYDRKSKKY